MTDHVGVADELLAAVLNHTEAILERCGDRYRDRAEQWLGYALRVLRDPASGMLYWGGHTSYDLEADAPRWRGFLDQDGLPRHMLLVRRDEELPPRPRLAVRSIAPTTAIPLPRPWSATPRRSRVDAPGRHPEPHGHPRSAFAEPGPPTRRSAGRVRVLRRLRAPYAQLVWGRRPCRMGGKVPSAVSGSHTGDRLKRR